MDSKHRTLLELHVKDCVRDKKNMSQKSVYRYFSKQGIEMNYTDIGIFLRDSYNGGKMPGYDMKQYEIGKSDRLEQIYYYKRGWLYSAWKLLGM